MTNEHENNQPSHQETSDLSLQLTPEQRKITILNLVSQSETEQLDGRTTEALERMIANIIEQTVTGLTAGESDEVILGKVRQHPTSFDFDLRDVDNDYIIHLINHVKILWIAPPEVLGYANLR